jgi:hypothetical protein
MVILWHIGRWNSAASQYLMLHPAMWAMAA